MISESQKKALKKYSQKNKELRQYINKKAATKNFILKLAKEEDIELISEWLESRMKNGATK